MNLMKVVLTKKKSLDVIEKDNIKSVAIGTDWWTLKDENDNTLQYLVSDYNCRILGVKS